MYTHVLTPLPEFHMRLPMLKCNAALGGFYELLMCKPAGIKDKYALMT